MYNLTNPFSFELPTKIEYGNGSLKKLGDELRRLQAKKVSVVTDEGIIKAGLLDKIIPIIEENYMEYSIFYGVEPNPKDLNVEKGAGIVMDFGADTIIALGGGSPIDCAKSIGVLAGHGGSRIKDYEGRGKVQKPNIPLIAIPTTSGTGSEVTFSSVINDTVNNYKMTVKSPLIAPKVAIVDPELTVTMPPAVTASTGLDALTHAIEAFTVNISEPISDALALLAVELINNHLVEAVNNGSNIEARAGMLMGSLLAGMAFSHSDVGSVHCMAETLGGIYDAPHGVCNSILLPYVMEYNKDYCKEKYAKIAKVMGIKFSTADEGADRAIDKIKELSKEVNLPSFSILKVKEADLEMMAEVSFKNGSTPSNPRPMTKEDYLVVFRKAHK
ncbi:MAG: iron-containing alcohol dehydrogenase [Dethiobacter sp.]|jgi:alcohol dehydrogenase|nr:iron-containing alcohol dehydrogenase [Dethiobacter sp.]